MSLLVLCYIRNSPCPVSIHFCFDERHLMVKTDTCLMHMAFLIAYFVVYPPWGSSAAPNTSINLYPLSASNCSVDATSYGSYIFDHVVKVHRFLPLCVLSSQSWKSVFSKTLMNCPVYYSYLNRIGCQLFIYNATCFRREGS